MVEDCLTPSCKEQILERIHSCVSDSNEAREQARKQKRWRGNLITTLVICGVSTFAVPSLFAFWSLYESTKTAPLRYVSIVKHNKQSKEITLITSRVDLVEKNLAEIQQTLNARLNSIDSQTCLILQAVNPEAGHECRGGR